MRRARGFQRASHRHGRHGWHGHFSICSYFFLLFYLFYICSFFLALLKYRFTRATRASARRTPKIQRKPATLRLRAWKEGESGEGRCGAGGKAARPSCTRRDELDGGAGREGHAADRPGGHVVSARSPGGG
jgi:hypothetical protein